MSNEWQPIETAPKGEPGPYNLGPNILGVSVGKWGCSYSIVRWHYHKNGKTGSWQNITRTWEPTHWMPLPNPPKQEA